MVSNAFNKIKIFVSVDDGTSMQGLKCKLNVKFSEMVNPPK